MPQLVSNQEQDMDPEATLQAAESALDIGQRREALDYLADYWSWRNTGGSEPDDGDLRAKAIGRICDSFRPRHSECFPQSRNVSF